MKKYFLLILASFEITSAVEFIQDANFRNGFYLLGNNDGDPTIKETIKIEEERIGDTVWRLAEWNSKNSLVGIWNGSTGKDFNAWVSDNSSTGWRWSNPDKSITVDFGRGSGDVTLAINADNDLNHVPSAYPDTGNLANGEYKNWWPHLLLEQQFINNPIPIVSTLVWSFNAKLIYWKRDRTGAWQDNPGEFVTYVLVKDKVTSKQLWLGMTIFSTYSNENIPYISPDIHTSIPIYKIGVNRVRGELTNYNNNVYQMLSNAINDYQEKGFSLGISLENAEIMAINLGWEVRGLDIGTMTISDLSLYSNSTTLGATNITSSSARIYWSDVENGANGYNIYENGNFVASVNPNIFNYVLMGLTESTNYTYEIRENTSNDIVAKINFQTTNISEIPKNVNILQVTSDSALIKWDEALNNESGFKIYKNNTLVTTVGANITDYLITGLEARTEYTYSVSSYNSIEESKLSSVTFKTKDDYAWFMSIYYLINN